MPGKRQNKCLINVNMSNRLSCASDGCLHDFKTSGQTERIYLGSNKINNFGWVRVWITATEIK